MPVKIRLQRHGSKKRPFYFIVVADARAPRDGKFIQKIGTYNPLTVPASIQLDRQRALDWLHKGAQPTDTVRRILSFKGIEAIINSMTPFERANPDVIDQSRRKRIAKGSGKDISDINAFIKQFDQMKDMMKAMNKMPMGGKMFGRR